MLLLSGEEIIVPDVRAYIHNKTDKSFVQQRAGHNVTGKAKIYLPNLGTLKNFPNFSGATAFNEPEGFDKIIDYDRTVYQVPTTGTTGWTAETGSVSSDGESIILTTTSSGDELDFAANVNTLEADRITFKIKASGSEDKLIKFDAYHGTPVNTAHRIEYDNDNITLTQNEWLTVDIPFVSGTTSTSIYKDGVRYATPVTTGASFDYEDNLRQLKFHVGDSVPSVFYIKEVKYYKSAEWSIHEINDYNDEFMSLSCVRTEGRRDSRRRAYGTAYNRP